MWPTPCASSHKGTGRRGTKSHAARLERFYLDAVVQEAEQIEGIAWPGLNPEWIEALIGFPPGWTEVQPSLFDGPPAPGSPSTDGSHGE